MTIKISANLGFLWINDSIPEAIIKASKFQFDAVEFHWPYEQDADKIKEYSEAYGMDIITINTPRGNLRKGDFGLAAIPGREIDARRNIETSLRYANRIGAKHVHIMAGITRHSYARDTFTFNLKFAAELAKELSIGILIEPMNPKHVPGYFLTELDQAISIINDLDTDCVRIIFDCYHLYEKNKSLLKAYKRSSSYVGHIQFSSLPNRGAPNLGSIDYSTLLRNISDLDYEGYFGAEYKPGHNIESELCWLEDFRNSWNSSTDNV